MTALAPKVVPAQAECLTAAGLQSQVLIPGDAEYEARQDSYWSNSAKIRPAAIVRPRSADEVSAAVKALVGVKQPFAVRSGGHTNWAGSNNIEGGVTIDLSLLNGVVYDASSETASIGPGCRWREVYAELHKHGRAVAGGREGNVGVAGLLLGGGNTFFTARRGWACDNVVAYEVVLADGRIINVDKDSYPDLFRALKGGSNNFGIVTKFTMTAIPCDKVWGGMTFLPKQVIPAAIEATTSFTDNVANDPDSNLVVIFTHMPDFKDVVVATLYANVVGIEKPPAYSKWLALPEILNTVKMTSISDMAFEYNIPAQMHDIWFTLSLKNDPRILAYASAVHDKLVADLTAFIPEQDFVTQCLFQPLPTIFGQNSVAAGGNVMGVERQPHNGILFLATAMLKTPEQEAFAYHKVKAWVESVKEFAQGIEGGLLEWRYLNYADKSQDPLASYGEANLELMREVAAKYDPDGVFQRLCPGGFKLSEVKA
ncbi:6-hydroxy-D-nicotine oxidase [Achaetomium macrosporum]|uniref:6-hydroxy-D-nicotine oxidase n=1 Tax=Achaetomium macrosporum TaxID=79813 RepID=A0AAN7HBF4_9PEZI|nr:6-hydroxy-D-nicotine oxidase [Achaetomium macrosporum]